MIAVFLLLNGACTRTGSIADCKPSVAVPANAAESAALEDARSRRSAVCSAAERLCQFQISKGHDTSAIEIRLDFIVFDGEDECAQSPYGSEALFYSAEGQFLRMDEIFSYR
jgi:hypothetical protein